jgi:hypothetical protein
VEPPLSALVAVAAEGGSEAALLTLGGNPGDASLNWLNQFRLNECNWCRGKEETLAVYKKCRYDYSI